MKRNVDPLGPCRGRTGRKAIRCNDSSLVTRKQPEPKRRKSILMRTDRYRRFFCAFCGETRPEGDLTGRDGRLLFCERCVTALDALCDGADDALAVLRRTS